MAGCPLLALSVIRGTATFCPLLDQSGQSWISARDSLSAFDSMPTFQAHRAYNAPTAARLAAKGHSAISDWRRRLYYTLALLKYRRSV